MSHSSGRPWWAYTWVVFVSIAAVVVVAVVSECDSGRFQRFGGS